MVPMPLLLLSFSASCSSATPRSPSISFATNLNTKFIYSHHIFPSGLTNFQFTIPKRFFPSSLHTCVHAGHTPSTRIWGKKWWFPRLSCIGLKLNATFHFWLMLITPHSIKQKNTKWCIAFAFMFGGGEFELTKIGGKKITLNEQIWVKVNISLKDKVIIRMPGWNTWKKIIWINEFAYFIVVSTFLFLLPTDNMNQMANRSSSFFLPQREL